MVIESYIFYINTTSSFFEIFVFLMGIFGNIISFKIYSNKSMIKSSFSIYFRVVCVSDFLITVHSFTFLLQSVYDYDLHIKNDFLCKTLDYVVYVLSPISGYLLVVISIDRFVKIKFTHRFEFIYKRKFQISLIIVIISYNVLFYSGFLWNKQLNENITVDNETNLTTVEYTCDDSPNMNAFYQMDVYNSAVVPYILMVFFSCATIWVVFQSRNKITPNSISNSGMSKRDKKFAFTSIALNTIFLILNLPVVLFIAYGNYLDEDLYNMIYKILNTLYYSNYGASLYVQLAVNSIFRSEFLFIFHLRTFNTHDSMPGVTIVH